LNDISKRYIGKAGPGEARQGKEKERRNDMKGNGKKTIGERSIYTQQLIKLMEKIQEGEVLKYQAMSDLIGMNTQAGNQGYSYQKSARDYLESQGIVFEVLENVGIKRMTAAEVGNSTGNIYLNQKKTAIKRARRKLIIVDDNYESLPIETRNSVDFARTILAFDGEMTKKSIINQIALKITEAQKMIGFTDTIKIFQK